jgi:hypothetical protein
LVNPCHLLRQQQSYGLLFLFVEEHIGLARSFDRSEIRVLAKRRCPDFGEQVRHDCCQ